MRLKLLITNDQLNRVLNEQVKNCNIFKSETTAQDYDDVLRGASNRLYKDTIGNIIVMTPEEYFERCAKMQGTSVRDQYSFGNDTETIRLLKLIKGGEKLDLPYIDYSHNQQEGRHRVFAAKMSGCNHIEVAIFLKENQEDPFKTDSNDEKEYGLKSMVNKWSDVMIDENGMSYIKYDYIKDIKLFLNLYPEFDENFDLYYAIINKNSKQNFEFNYSPDKFTFTKNIPELNYFLLKKFRENVTDKELVDDWGFDESEINEIFNDSNPEYINVIDYIRILSRSYGRLASLYHDIRIMLNTIYEYIYYINNKNYFEDIDDDEYKVYFDSDNKIIRLYYNGRYSTNLLKYKDGKEMLYHEKLKLKNYSPKIEQDDGLIVIPSKYVTEYLKKIPLK